MVEFYASELLEYSAAAKNVVDQMIMTGSGIDDLDFVNPTSAGFDTAPHIHKLYHPEGGGLTYQEKYSENIEREIDTQPAAGIYIGHFNNTEWTPSTANDVMMAFHQISTPVCEKINEKITGSKNIPVHSYWPPQELFIDSSVTGHISGSNTNFTTAICGDCEGYPQLCVIDGNLTYNIFYTILAAR